MKTFGITALVIYSLTKRDTALLGNGRYNLDIVLEFLKTFKFFCTKRTYGDFAKNVTVKRQTFDKCGAETLPNAFHGSTSLRLSFKA